MKTMNTDIRNCDQWAVESEVYRRGSSVVRRAEFRTFATRGEADAWVQNQLQKWRLAQAVVAYMAQVCRCNNGLWLPVAAWHSCRRGVLKGAR